MHSTTSHPKCDDSRRNMVCINPARLPFQLKNYVLSTGQQYLKTKGFREALFVLYCDASAQNYHILIFNTNQGLIRLNIYSNRGALSVNEEKTIDGALTLGNGYGQPI